MRNKIKIGLLALLACGLFAPFVMAQVNEALCTDNAHILIAATLRYAQAHDEHLPPMDTDTDIVKALLPYVKSPRNFFCPATNQFYQFNRALSGVTIASIGDLGTTELLRDARQHADGKITIAYLDGYVTHGGVDLTPAADCAVFARRLAVAAQAYAWDYDGVMPAMTNTATFDQLLTPYVHDSRGFSCPVTGLAFTPNAVLSGVQIGTIVDTGTTEVLRDAQPHPDGKVTIAYMDGVVTQGGVDTAPDTDCATFLGKFAYAVVEYAGRQNGVFPLMQNNATLQSAIFPYTNDSRVWTCPATGQLYTLNAALSGVNIATIPDQGTVIVAQDAQTHASGKSTVAYLDGHVLQNDVAQPDNETACRNSVGELARATMQYVQDHDEVFPPMKTYQQFFRAIYPYVRSTWKFRCPATRLNYVVNPALSGVSLASIDSPSQTVFIRDAKLHADHMKTLGYADGHVEQR